MMIKFMNKIKPIGAFHNFLPHILKSALFGDVEIFEAKTQLELFGHVSNFKLMFTVNLFRLD